MEKLLLCIIVLSSQISIAMQIVEPTEPQKTWRNNFNKLDKNSYNAAVGYDLQLTLRQDDRPEVVHKIPSLLVHGWGSSPVGVVECARFVGPHRIPGDAFTFYFPDGTDSFNPLFICNSSLGQEKDIKSLLVALKAAYDCQIPGCNLFGQSRGAGAIVNALSVLNTHISQWPGVLDNIKTLYPEGSIRKKIVKMIKNGVVVLDTPMVSTQAGLNAHAHKILRGIFFEKFLCDLIDNYVLPVITRGNYKPSGPQAIKSAENIPDGLKVLLSYQFNDSSVGNVHDKDFAQKLYDRLKKEDKTNLWVVLGYDAGGSICQETWDELKKAAADAIIKRWGTNLPSTRRKLPAHNAGHITLLESGILNELYRQNGGSYVNNESSVATKANRDLQNAEFSLPKLTKWMENSADSKKSVISNRLTFSNVCLVIGGWGTLIFTGGCLAAYFKGYAPEQIYSFLKNIFIDLMSKKLY